MTRIAWLRRILATSLVLSVGALLVWVGHRLNDRRKVPPAEREIRRSTDLDLTGLDLTSFNGQGHEVRLHTDRLVYRPRRIGPLTIRLLKEIELNGVRLVVDDSAHGEAREPDPLPGGDADRFLEDGIVPTIREAFANLLTVHNLGFVSRVSVVGFDLEVRRRGASAARLHAGRVRLDTTGRGFTLVDGVDLLSPSGDRLEAQEARWDPVARKLVVSGDYLLRRGDEARSGTGNAVSFGRSGEIVLQ